MNAAGPTPSPEPLWREALRKILILEESKGFADTAVSGGLRRFVARWEPELRACLAGDTERTQQLIDAPYRDLSPDQRRAWVAGWQAALDGISTAAADAAPPAPPATPPPAARTTTPTPPAEPAPAMATPTPSAIPADDYGDDDYAVAVGNTPQFASAALHPGRVRRAAYGAPAPSATPGDPDEPASQIRRMDAKTVQRLETLGVHTARDLLYMLPRRIDDRAAIADIASVWPGGVFTLEGELVDLRASSVGPRRLQLVEGVLRDDSGEIGLQWFGQAYLTRTLRVGSRLALHGKVDSKSGRMVMASPEYDVITPSQPPQNCARLTPIYRLTQGMTARNLRSLTWQAIGRYRNGVAETLPEATLRRVGLVPLRQAVSDAHYPPDAAAADAARRRLAFDEILSFQLAVIGRRQHRERSAVGIPVKYDKAALDAFLSALPFAPTGAQQRCIAEILSDLGRGTPPMSRLLQGEVGSGKTLAALAAVLATASAGGQSALMAPTEVLAEQHFRTVGGLLQGLEQPMQTENLLSVYLPRLSKPFTVGLLTGSTRARPRREALRMAAEGHLDLLIGTHALIQDGVELPNLTLAIADEQHRFGVEQRSTLRGAGATPDDAPDAPSHSPAQPHSLMMSATPIPRTLQLTLYGDLDISTIDELPPGRQEIMTRVVAEDKRRAAYGFVRQQVGAGRQAFIICPLVEESDKLEARAAVDEHKRLSAEVFPELNLGLIHGRLSAREKDKVMRQFRDGAVDILVATAVVEVGIDVPNASVMLIDGADRFGLAQLHQFRGRVGRGEHKSYCLLLSESASERAQERLSALESTRDGFKLAEVDLQMRHEGDIFGTSQSGEQTMLRIANLFDQDLIALARTEALSLMDADPGLADPAHAELAAQRDRFLARVQQNLTD